MGAYGQTNGQFNCHQFFNPCLRMSLYCMVVMFIVHLALKNTISKLKSIFSTIIMMVTVYFTYCPRILKEPFNL